MSGYRFLSLAKRSLLCLFLACLVAVTIQGYLLLSDLRQSIKDGQAAAAQIAQDTRETLAEWRGYTAALKAQTDDPQVKRGVGLLLRSGDDLARTVKKANVVLETLNDAIRDTSANLNTRTLPGLDLAVSRTADQINAETLPEITETIRATRKTIEATGTAIETLTLDAHGTLRESRLAIEAMKFRVEDKKFDEIIENIEQATAHANESLYHVEVTTKRLTKPVHWFWRGVKTTVVVVGRIFVP